MFKLCQIENLSDVSTFNNMIFIGGLSGSMLVKKNGEEIEPTSLDFGTTSGTLLNNVLYFSNLDHEIMKMDIASNKIDKVYEHDYLVTQLVSTPYGIVSLGLDNKIKLDGRQVVTVEEAPLRMTVKDHLLDVALMDKTRLTFDLRHFDKPIETHTAGLKYMIRDMIHHKGNIAYSSIEGRVQCSESFAFKCHRKKSDGQECIYPVHALASMDDYLVTGGGDGFICYWDVDKRKRSKITEIGGSVYRLSPFGSELVIGTEEGSVYAIPAQ